MKLNRGILIAIEGIDGSGKSTLARNLTTKLQEKNFPTLLTKEPGGTSLGNQIRTIVQHHQAPLSAKAEFLLFAADRAQHFYELIMPHLQRNNIVISDRMADSSVAYQGYGRGLEKEFINTVNRWAMNSIKPDLTIYVHVPYEIAHQRLAARNALTRFEKEHETFIKQLINGFTEIAAHNKQSITIDGTCSEHTVTDVAMEAIVQWIHTHAT